MLSIIDVFAVADGSKRPIREGEAYLNSKLLYGVGKKEQNGDVYTCQGLAVQTSAVNSAPHEINIKFDKAKEEGKRVLMLECSCIAGASGKCKHAVATILWLTRFSEEDVLDLSCTDIEQQWDKLKSKGGINYEGSTLKDLCHCGEKTDVYNEEIPPVKEETKKKWRDNLLKCKSSS